MAKLDLVNPTTIPISNFGGLYSRGMHDTVPLGYFQDCLNVDCSAKDEVKTRFGSSVSVTLAANIVRAALYKRLNETSRWLILTDEGKLYDSVYSLATPVITNAAFADFSMVNYNNRAYITFHNRVTGVGSGLYVYQGDGTIRLAAGTPPSSFVLGVATSASAGSVEIGTHLFAVVFESNSGFLSAPGPAIFAEYDAPGDFKVDISSVPVGPAGTTARWIVATPVLPDYDGNQYSGEFFFIPSDQGGRIGDNTTTTTTVDFYDSDLYVSADYLLDNRSTIPAGSFITIYNNRIVLGGVSGDAHSLYISKENEPEVFNSLSDRLTVDPSDATFGVTNAISFRNSLFITKNNRTYTTQALSGIEPINWAVDTVDAAIGTQCFGIATILDAKGANTDRWFIADVSGLYAFESGLFRKPALSYNIEDIWKRINKTYFNKVQVAHDAENFVIYIAVPLDNATSISHVLCAFYGETINTYGSIIPQKINWSIYTFSPTPSSITVDVDSSSRAVLKFSGATGNIYAMSTSSYLDTAAAIDSYVDFGMVTPAPQWVCHFSHLQFRIKGNGTLDLTLKGLDDSQSITNSSFLTLSSSPGVELGYKINFINEKMSVKIRSAAAGEYFDLAELYITGKPKWKTRSE